MDQKPELAIAFDPSRVSEQTILQSLQKLADQRAWPMQVILHRMRPDAGYLDYKNECFARTSRDIVVFLDSDTVPEPGWLRRLLSPFCNPKISVVTGNTYIDCDSVYARAVGLYWFYPPRCSQDGLRPSNVIWPSNAAFRREVFARFPFPAGKYFRAKVYEHAHACWRAGIPALQQMGARGAHPPPSGWYWFKRALHQGHDFALLEAEPGYHPPFATFARMVRQTLTRISARRREIGAGWGTMALSLALALIYYSLVLFGQILSRSCPRLAERVIAT